MMVVKLIVHRLMSLVFLFGLMLQSALAHLMVAQHGTLNFLDKNVYMVLSLPASSFGDADADGDGKLSLIEFSENRVRLIDLVADTVRLRDEQGVLPLEGILLSPVTPHDAPKEPAAQLVVMGRFVLSDKQSPLTFSVDIIGQSDKEKTLDVTATNKAASLKETFELNADSRSWELFAKE